MTVYDYEKLGKHIVDISSWSMEYDDTDEKSKTEASEFDIFTKKLRDEIESFRIDS